MLCLSCLPAHLTNWSWRFRSAQKKIKLLFRDHFASKNSQTRDVAKFAQAICLLRHSAKFRLFSPQNFAHILRENSRMYLRNVNGNILMNLNYLNLNYSVIWRIIANSELKVSHHIDRSHFFFLFFSQRFCFDLYLMSFAWWQFRLFDVQCELKRICHVVNTEVECNYYSFDSYLPREICVTHM